jgi:hypothetical protein
MKNDRAHLDAGSDTSVSAAFKTILTCDECRRAWLTSIERWRMYLSDDTPPLPVAYCPRCARRGSSPSPRPRY